MECEPAANVAITNVAWPEPFTGCAGPMALPPSLNVTVPVGFVPVTVAVKVTDWLYPEGFSEDATEVVVGFTPLFTVCVRTAEVLPE